MNFGRIALLALASAGMVFFASCNGNKEKKSAPVILVKTGTNLSDLKGDATEASFPLTVIAKPASGLKVSTLEFSVAYKNAAGQDATQAKKKISGKNETAGYTGMIQLADLPAGVKEGTITIFATDSDKSESKLDIKYNLSGTTPTPNPGETGWDAEKQGAINHATGGKNGAFNLKAGKGEMLATGKPEDRYMMNTSKEKQDFVAGWSSKEVNGLASKPKGNNTAFVKATVDYDKVTVADAETAFKAATASTDVAAVAEGDVYLAQKGTEFYIIKITKVDNDNNSTRKGEKGCIEFSYKAKK